MQPLHELSTLKYHVHNDKCKIPEMDVWSRLVQPLITKAAPNKCHERQLNLTYVHNSVLMINDKLLEDKGYGLDEISCCYNTIERVKQSLASFDKDADNLFRLSYYKHMACDVPSSYSEECYRMEKVTVPKSDFVKVTCKEIRVLPGGLSYVNFHAVPTFGTGRENSTSSRSIQRKISFWKNCLNAKHKNADQLSEEEKSCGRLLTTAGPPPNVLVLGMDSTSQINFKRFMHRTVKLLEGTIDAVELKGYTKVGENTFPNMVPIMTSFSEDELVKICYHSRWTPQDKCPYLWKKFAQQNYLTAHLEDAPKMASFNYLKTGFIRSPVDIYLRPFMTAAYNHVEDWPYLVECIENQRPEEIILDYIVNIASVADSNQIPYFLTSWLTDLTHDDMNSIQNLDELLSNTILKLLNKGLLKNTILLIMSDHGYRFLNVRETTSGWYEDKLPTMWIKLPASVAEAHPSWLEALYYNSRQLSTPYDLHATFKTIHETFAVLEIPNTRKLSEMEALSHAPPLRGLSLFEKLPFRTCDDAGIPTECCACVPVVEYKTNLTFVELAGRAVVRDINEDLPAACTQLKLAYITASGAFQSERDSASSVIPVENELPEQLIVAVRTAPGDFRYEVWVKYNKTTNTFTSVWHRLRLNKLTTRVVNLTTEAIGILSPLAYYSFYTILTLIVRLHMEVRVENTRSKNVQKSVGKSMLFILVFFLLIIIAKVELPKRRFPTKTDSVVDYRIRVYFRPRSSPFTIVFCTDFKGLENSSETKFLINNEKCRIPEFNVRRIDGRVLTEMENREIIECEQTRFNMTYIKNDVILINSELMVRMGYDLQNISCCYSMILREKVNSLTNRTLVDRKVRYSRCIPMKTEGGTRPLSRFIKVKCETNGNLRGLKEIIYEGFHALPMLSAGDLKKKVKFWAEYANSSKNGRSSDNIRNSLKIQFNKYDLPPNVLLIGLDSTSRMNSQRLMHLTIQVLNDTLKAVEMMGYNKVGYNTFPNIAPLLTSFSETELQSKCLLNRWVPQDNCPYIFKHFSSSNYLTAHLEDAPRFAIFNYWKAGFVNPPLDIYLRPFMIAMYNELRNKNRPRCLHKSPEEIIFDYIVDLASSCREKSMPYFITSWLTDLTHEDTLQLGVMDYLLAATLRRMQTEGLLENTVLLIMSDHGYRFKSVRRTIRGWYEDKLPMFWISIPPSLQKSHKHWKEALVHNSRELVTPFDVHEMLRDILLLSLPKRAMKLDQQRKSHGISLFKKHPHRSCEEASIPEQYCACYVPTTYGENQTLIMLGAQAIVSHINNIIPPSCKRFKILKVTSSGMLSGTLARKNSTLFGQRKSSSVLQLIIGLITMPGDFHIEAWVTFDKATSGVSEVSHISRVSEMSERDKNQLPACLDETTVDMMEFCYCDI
ncbi:hypothetical protein Ocin01_04569 [Orchesella cincta]|uniref:Uncharacterized protein n=1 Tax=Orchesella cincta TaxID=48709 RepID=A0A1D2NA19_ORCCI|nr:hypothetical protein Ocin01_04569 [Orchesella cincta]